MNISEFCIRHPVATTLMSVALVAAGIFAYLFLPVAALPNVLRVLPNEQKPRLLQVLRADLRDRADGSSLPTSELNTAARFGDDLAREMQAALERSEAQAAAGQTVPLSEVLAMLDRGILEAEQRQMELRLARQAM